MKKIKLNPLEKQILTRSFIDLSGFLNAIKRKKLEGQALNDMRTLEESVQNLECFLLGK